MSSLSFSSIISFGVTENAPNFLKKKITVTNFISFAFFFLCIPFTWFTFVFFREVVIYPALFMLFSLVILVLNALKLYFLSRFVVCVIYISLYTIWHCYLLPNEEPLIASLYSVQIVFWMIPWLVFDLNEYKSLLVYTLFYLIVSISVPYLNNFFTYSFNVEDIKSGWLATLIFILAAISITAPLFFLMFINHQNETTLAQLLQKMEMQKNDLEEKERKNFEYIQQIEQAKVEDEKRNWVNEGISQFSQLTQKIQIEGLFVLDELTSKLVKYIHANQAGIFLLKRDPSGGESFLSLESCYAYDRKKYLHKRISIGEGLVGQTFLEQKKNYLSNVPDDYIKITSGLGGALPTHIIIIPLVYLGRSCGVIELAGFYEFQPHHQKLLDAVSDSLASAIYSISTSTLNQD